MGDCVSVFGDPRPPSSWNSHMFQRNLRAGCANHSLPKEATLSTELSTITEKKKKKNELRPNPPLQSSCQAVFPSLLKSSQGGYRVLSMQAWMRWKGRWHFTNLPFLQAGGEWPVLTAPQIQVPPPQILMSTCGWDVVVKNFAFKVGGQKRRRKRKKKSDFRGQIHNGFLWVDVKKETTETSSAGSCYGCDRATSGSL